MDAIDQLNGLLTSYQNILKLCYDALDAGAPQEQRDALRKSIEAFVSESSD
jgi:hypothetical protein